MKPALLITLICLLLGSITFSQGNISYGLQIVDNSMKPVANLKVSATETSSFQNVSGATDANGMIMLELNNGKEWKISIGEIKKDLTIKSLPFQAIQMGEVYIYDLDAYKRKQEQDPARTNDGFKEIKQTANEDTPFEQPNCMLNITIKHPEGKTLSGVNVKLVNVKGKTIYSDVTDANGVACFIVPNKTKYEIDVNNSKNFHFADFTDEFVNRSLDIQYVPTVVEETVKNDTIFQVSKSNYTPSTDRALIKINVTGGKKGGKGEKIFLRNVKTGQVYATTTDNQGTAYVQLPPQNIYLIDFKNQKDVDAINLMSSKEMTTGEKNVFYSPDPRLEYPEKFIPTPDNLFTKSFNNFLTKQYEKPKDKPFFLKFSNGNKINKESKEALFKLTLASSGNYGNGVRLPLNIVFVLDKSGSMYGEGRSEALKNSLWDIGNVLTDKDVVSVVLFTEEAYAVQHTKSNHIKGFETVIENYNPGGGTNIFNGIQAAVEQAMLDYDPNRSNIILLLTDGYGVTPPQEITDYVAEHADESGIQFSTIGMGYWYNQSLLELIAEKGYGTFSYADSSMAITNAILTNVKNAFNYVAKDVKVTIAFDDHLEFENLYGFRVEEASEGKITFNIDKVPANFDQLAFLKFRIKEASADIESKPINVSVQYYDLVQKKEIKYDEELTLEWTEESDTALLLDQEEKTLYAMAILNQTLKVMADANQANDRKLARKTLKAGIKQIDEIFPDAKPKDIKSLFEDAVKYLTLFDQMAKNEE